MVTIRIERAAGYKATVLLNGAVVASRAVQDPWNVQDWASVGELYAAWVAIASRCGLTLTWEG